MQRCPLSSYKPNLDGLIPDQQVIDAQKRMVAAAVKELPLWQKIVLPKNWPTWVKVGAAAGVGAALKALGVSGGIITLVTSIFGG